jgi:hypothetical protein
VRASADNQGMFDSSSMTIEIDSDLSSAKRWAALIHEMLHATLELSGVEQVLEDLSGSSAVEEIIVRLMETTFVNIMHAHGDTIMAAWAGEQGAPGI